MPNESSRIFRPDLRQHEHADPVDSGAGEPMLPRPDESEPAAGGTAGTLRRENGKVYYANANGGEAVAVRIVWARPLSGRGGPVSILHAEKKREMAYLADLNELDAESRRIAGEELKESMILPNITVIHSVRQRFGNYYWDVETDRGRRKFLLSSPETNSLRPREDAVVIRDVSGNCYEIASVAALDKSSRSALERVL